MDGFEQFWSKLTRILSFFVGIAIMIFETVNDSSDRPWLYAAAVGMMGLPIARTAENILSRFSGTGPQALPSKQTPEQPIETQPVQIHIVQPPQAQSGTEGTSSGGPK